MHVRRRFAIEPATQKMATQTSSLSVDGARGEFQITDCTRRRSYQEVFGQGFDSPRIHQNNMGAYASAPPYYFVELFNRGVERSEQNNPVSCFVNGDRRIVRDATKNSIQSIEQNSRTTPLGFHWQERPRGACDTNRGSHSALEDRQARLSGAECRNIRRRRKLPRLTSFLTRSRTQ